MGELVIHRLTRERLKDVQIVIREAFQRHIEIDQLLAKYDTSIFSEHNYLCTVGYIDEKPIAFYGAIPLVFDYEGQRILGVQACDSYTHPDFQRQGIHYKLAQASYTLMRNAGVSFVYAFHSALTMKACERLGWSLHQEFVRFHIPTNRKWPIFRVLSRFKWLKGLKKVAIKRAIRGWNEKEVMVNQYVGKNALVVPFSPEYTKYKNQRNNRILEIEGCTVWLRLDYIVQVGAIDGLTDENMNHVLNRLRKLARAIGAKEVVFQMYPDGDQYERLSSRLEGFPSFHLGYLQFDEEVDFTRYKANAVEFDSFL